VSQEDAEILEMRAYLSETEIYNDYSIPPLLQTLKEIREEFFQQVFLNSLFFVIDRMVKCYGHTGQFTTTTKVYISVFITASEKMFGIRYSSPLGMILLMILGFFVGLMIVYFVFSFIHTQPREPGGLHGMV